MGRMIDLDIEYDEELDGSDNPLIEESEDVFDQLVKISEQLGDYSK